MTMDGFKATSCHVSRLQGLSAARTASEGAVGCLYILSTPGLTHDVYLEEVSHGHNVYRRRE